LPGRLWRLRPRTGKGVEEEIGKVREEKHRLEEEIRKIHKEKADDKEQHLKFIEEKIKV
jgi:hypothetical protein